MALYTAVEFANNGGLALVSSSWLTPRKKEAFWPPFKTSVKFDKAVLKAEEPKEDGTWKLLAVKRCYFETDNFESGKRKLKTLEFTSDCETSEQDDHSGPRPKRSCKKINFSDNDESSDRDDDVSDISLSALPSNSLQLPSLKTPKAVSQNTILSCSINKSGDVTKTLQTLQMQLDCPEKQTQVSNDFQLTPNKVSRTSTPNKTSETATPTNNANYTSTSSQITPFDHKLLSILLQIKQQNDMLLESMNNLTSTLTSTNNKNTNNILLDNFPVQFPVNSQDELDILEGYLQDADNLKTLIIHLSSLGGREIPTKVNKILKYLLSNQVATGFNYLGSRSNKKAFFQLKLKTAVIAAVKTTSAITEKEIEDAIKVWLKHAPQRLKIEQKK